MSWLFFAILSYFIAAIVAVLDKVILSKDSFIPRPAIYATYVGLSGIYALLLIPFGFDWQTAREKPIFVLLSAASGFIWVFFLLPLYRAVRQTEVSRAGPLVGVFTAVFTFILSFFFLGERFNDFQLFSFVLLLLGAYLISSRNFNWREYPLSVLGLCALSAFLLAVSFTLIKFVYLNVNFMNGYVMGRMGEFFAGVFLLSLPKNKIAVKEHLKSIKMKTVGLFSLSKVLGATFFILQNYAVFLGSVAMVHALVGLQYVFLLFLTIILSIKIPSLLGEEISKKIVGRKIIAVFFITLGLFALALSQKPEKLAPGVKIWGMTFSKPFAEQMGLDWKEPYLAALDDLNFKAVRLPAYWPEIEPREGEYDFTDLDWQVEEAAKRGTKIILAAGLKLPRWPECHIPLWAGEFPISNSQFPNEKLRKALLKYIEETINHYKDNPAVWAWQIENEPFLSFGECPTVETEFLDKEIALAKSLDGRPIIVTDSGELSSWISAAKRADVFGTTMYRVIWSEKVPFGGYFKYPLPAEFFWLKANLASYFADIKKIIVVELQGEPWGPKLIYETPYEGQMKSMDFKQFRENIAYAEKAGFEEVYWFGVEWWYKMKQEGHPEYWGEIKNLKLKNEK